jgi:hypothetical protein
LPSSRGIVLAKAHLAQKVASEFVAKFGLAFQPFAHLTSVRALGSRGIALRGFQIVMSRDLVAHPLSIWIRVHEMNVPFRQPNLLVFLFERLSTGATLLLVHTVGIVPPEIVENLGSVHLKRAEQSRVRSAQGSVSLSCDLRLQCLLLSL